MPSERLASWREREPITPFPPLHPRPAEIDRETTGKVGAGDLGMADCSSPTLEAGEKPSFSLRQNAEFKKLQPEDAPAIEGAMANGGLVDKSGVTRPSAAVGAVPVFVGIGAIAPATPIFSR
ncbi:MAG: hypothetical protein RMJ52_18405 [Gemmataceae bacterium]|nr:hypothetical protein [Gemmataceae bacterium]